MIEEWDKAIMDGWPVGPFWDNNECQPMCPGIPPFDDSVAQFDEFTNKGWKLDMLIGAYHRPKKKRKKSCH